MSSSSCTECTQTRPCYEQIDSRVVSLYSRYSLEMPVPVPEVRCKCSAVATTATRRNGNRILSPLVVHVCRTGIPNFECVCSLIFKSIRRRRRWHSHKLRILLDQFGSSKDTRESVSLNSQHRSTYRPTDQQTDGHNMSSPNQRTCHINAHIMLHIYARRRGSR